MARRPESRCRLATRSAQAKTQAVSVAPPFAERGRSQTGRGDAALCRVASLNAYKTRAVRLARNGRLGAAAGHEAFALSLLASQLASATNRLGLLANALLRGLLVEVAHLHLTEDAFPLKLLLESAESLIDVVVANEYLHRMIRFQGFKSCAEGRRCTPRLPREAVFPSSWRLPYQKVEPLSSVNAPPLGSLVRRPQIPCRHRPARPAPDGGYGEGHARQGSHPAPPGLFYRSARRTATG